MERPPVSFRSAVYHIHEKELLDSLAVLGKRIGIKNKTEREKLANAIKYFNHRSQGPESGDSLYIRTHIKDGIQKAIFMDGDCITEEMIRSSNLLSSTTAILSIQYGRSEGYYDVETFIPI